MELFPIEIFVNHTYTVHLQHTVKYRYIFKSKNLPDQNKTIFSF